MSNGSHQTFSSSSDPNTIPWDVPYKTPPAGITSNFDHPDVHTRNVIIITLAVTLGIALIFFIGRIGTRIFILRSLGWDDFLCVCGVAFSVAFNATVLERIQYGLGVANWDIRLRYYLTHNLLPFLYWFQVGIVLRHFSLMFLKLSIIALYLRVINKATNIHRKTRYICYAAIVWVICYNFGMLGWIWSVCDPPAKLYHYKIPGNCKLSGIWKELTGWEVMNVFTDVVLFFLPLPMAYSLNMPLKQKIAFTWVLTTGLFCCIASVVCFVISLRIIRQQSTEDVLQLWAIIECNIAIICICLPAMRQLIARKFGLETSKLSPGATPNNGSSKHRFLSPGKFFVSKASSSAKYSSAVSSNPATKQPSRHFDPLATTDSEKAYAAVHLEKDDAYHNNAPVGDEHNQFTHAALHPEDNNIFVKNEMDQYAETAPMTPKPTYGSSYHNNGNSGGEVGGTPFRFADIGELEQGKKAYDDKSTSGVGSRAYHAI